MDVCVFMLVCDDALVLGEFRSVKTEEGSMIYEEIDDESWCSHSLVMLE
jgi:hypothetical protein